jgi:ribosomal protein S18 acetylase RimI-like enzyme
MHDGRMDPMSVEHDYAVREAILSDAEAITGVVNRAFEIEKFFKSGDRTDCTEVAEMMRDGKLLLLTAAGQIVACVFVKVNGNRMYAGLLAVDPLWRVPGAGPRLMNETENYARAKGCKWLDIRIVSVRPELKRLYRKRGFVETGTEPGDSIETATQPVHFITMSKPL